MRVVPVIILVFGVLLTVLPLGNAENTISIDAQNPAIFEVDPKFLSVTFDSSGLIDDPQSILYKFKNEKLRKLVRHLSPAYFRVGGTMADTIIFYQNNAVKEDYPNAEYGYPINETTLLDLTEATDSMEVELIFDLAAGLLRKEDGSWDSTNAEEIIKFCDDNNLNVNWELGNEPDLFVESSVLPNINSFNGSQIGKDVLVLKQILSNTKNYKNALLVGPDVLRIDANGRGNTYLEEFLAVAGKVVDAITWHHYYFAGPTATLSEYIDPNIFDSLKIAIQAGLDIVNGLNFQQKTKWLGETSSGWSGGAPNLSDRYAATFIWLDKLGVSAKMGLSAVVRQTIISGGYTLIDTDTDEANPIPNPDWWLSIVFKKLVGTKVLSLDANTDAAVRLYAHCTTDSFSKGSVTVYGVNLADASATINIESLTKSNQKISVQAFELTSGSESSLVTQDIQLNGKLLQVTTDYELPELSGKTVDVSRSSTLTMPAYSNVFWVISGAEIQACSS